MKKKGIRWWWWLLGVIIVINIINTCTGVNTVEYHIEKMKQEDEKIDAYLDNRFGTEEELEQEFEEAMEALQ